MSSKRYCACGRYYIAVFTTKTIFSFLFLCCVIPPERVGIVYKSINVVAMVFSTFNMASCQDLKARRPWDEVANSFFCFVLFCLFFFFFRCFFFFFFLIQIVHNLDQSLPSAIWQMKLALTFYRNTFPRISRNFSRKVRSVTGLVNAPRKLSLKKPLLSQQSSADETRLVLRVH